MEASRRVYYQSGVHIEWPFFKVGSIFEKGEYS